MAGLDRWLAADRAISVQLLTGRAGAGKTRLAFEFLWQVFRERSEQWQMGLVTSDSFRQMESWDKWLWRQPTLLVLDYAMALGEPLRRLLGNLALLSLSLIHI